MTTSAFSFAGLELRSVIIDGNPWFVAKDVARILGLSLANITQHTRNLGAGEKALNPIKTVRGEQATITVSESGLYKLVMRSDKPQAKEFQNWVTGTVLPAIRETGGYIKGEEKLATGEMVTAIRMPFPWGGVGSPAAVSVFWLPD